MNNVVKGSLIFAVGMGIGSAISWVIAKQKFNKIIEEMVPEPEANEPAEPEKEPVEEDKEKKAKMAHVRYAGKDPETITAEEFDEGEEEYERESLTYYEGDKVLMNAYGQDVTARATELVGDEFEDEFVGDVCYVRNHKLMTDYEILLEHGTSGDAEGDDE